MTTTIRRIVERWCAWKKRRYWTPERQIENLRRMICDDDRWLAHNKIASALTARYAAALAPDWYKRVHTDAANFRRSIGLEPVNAFTEMNSPENLERLNRIALGHPKYTDGPLPENGWD